MLTIPEIWRTSLTKYPIIANIKSSVDSFMAECEMNLIFLSNKVGMIPHNVPTEIDLKHKVKNVNIVLR